MAFAGKTSELADRVDVSTSGLLSKLLDKEVINRKQSELVEVAALMSPSLFLCRRKYMLCPVLIINFVHHFVSNIATKTNNLSCIKWSDSTLLFHSIA